jgi:hypothetical protein
MRNIVASFLMVSILVLSSCTKESITVIAQVNDPSEIGGGGGTQTIQPTENTFMISGPFGYTNQRINFLNTQVEARFENNAINVTKTVRFGKQDIIVDIAINGTVKTAYDCTSGASAPGNTIINVTFLENQVNVANFTCTNGRSELVTYDGNLPGQRITGTYSGSCEAIGQPRLDIFDGRFDTVFK